MEMKLNEKTNVEVSAKLSVFRTKNKQNANEDVLYIRNDKIFAAAVKKITRFRVRLFLLLLLIGMFGGYGHFMYDTQYLGYRWNPGIVLGIVLVFVIAGFFASWHSVKYLVLSAGGEGGKVNRFEIPIGKDVTDKNLEDLMYLLVN